jgi:hypothetical protein
VTHVAENFLGTRKGLGEGGASLLRKTTPIPGHMASAFDALCVVASAYQGSSCAREPHSWVLLCLLRLLVPARSAILQLRLVLTSSVFVALLHSACM